MRPSLERLESRVALTLTVTGITANQVVHPGDTIAVNISGVDFGLDNAYVGMSYADSVTSNGVPVPTEDVSTFINPLRYHNNTNMVPYPAQGLAVNLVALGVGTVEFHIENFAPNASVVQQEDALVGPWFTVYDLYPINPPDRTAAVREFTVPFQVVRSDRLAFVDGSQPTDVDSGAPQPNPVEVEAIKPDGSLDSGFIDPISITIGTNPGNGTLSGGAGGSLTVTPIGGIASFPSLVIDKPGQGYTLDATDKLQNIGTAVSNSFNVGVGDTLAFSSQPQDTDVDSKFGSDVVVQVNGPDGNTDPNFSGSVTVQLESPDGGHLKGNLTAPVIEGYARFSGLSVDKAGQGEFLEAGSGVKAAPARSKSFNIERLKIKFLNAPREARKGVLLPDLIAEVVDEKGKVDRDVDGAKVLLSFASYTSDFMKLSLLGNTEGVFRLGIAKFTRLRFDGGATNIHFDAVIQDGTVYEGVHGTSDFFPVYDPELTITFPAPQTSHGAVVGSSYTLSPSGVWKPHDTVTVVVEEGSNERTFEFLSTDGHAFTKKLNYLGVFPDKFGRIRIEAMEGDLSQMTEIDGLHSGIALVVEGSVSVAGDGIGKPREIHTGETVYEGEVTADRASVFGIRYVGTAGLAIVSNDRLGTLIVAPALNTSIGPGLIFARTIVVRYGSGPTSLSRVRGTTTDPTQFDPKRDHVPYVPAILTPSQTRATFSGTYRSTGSLTIMGPLKVDGLLYVNGNLTVHGYVTGTGTIVASGNISFLGGASFGNPPNSPNVAQVAPSIVAGQTFRIL
jgi:hypothetical protein